MPEAIFNQKDVRVVGRSAVAELERLATASPTRRYRLCLHRGTEDRVHEMVIALAGPSYVQPHRHPKGKAESYHVIKGEMDVFFFDEAGKVVRLVEMGDAVSGKAILYRLSARAFHMPLPRTPSTVFHEVYEGPFVKDEDVDYARWAPPETDEKAAKDFVARCYAAAAALGADAKSSLGDDLRP